MSIVNPYAKRDLYLPAIDAFFKNPSNIKKTKIFIRILNGKKINHINERVSINQIERYVLKFKKDTNIYYKYNLQLKNYTKKYFDPICRRSNDPTFPYEYGDKKYIQTNIKQLNFFKWFLGNDIFDSFKKDYDNFKEYEKK